MFLVELGWLYCLTASTDFDKTLFHQLTAEDGDTNMSRVMRKPTLWFPTWSNTIQAVQLQKMARGLTFRTKKVDGLYYLCSENKGADQLRGYREADNCEADPSLCFRICKMLVFS